MKKILLASMLSGLVMASSLAQAENTTTNFESTATVSSSCTISAQNASFGDIDILTASFSYETFYAHTQLSVLCNNGVSYLAYPEQGNVWYYMNAVTGDNTDRLMYTLEYQTGSWANEEGANPISEIGNGSIQSHTVSARLPSTILGNRTARPDTYSGNIAVILSY